LGAPVLLLDGLVAAPLARQEELLPLDRLRNQLAGFAAND
jgi:hypothetical protein